MEISSFSVFTQFRRTTSKLILFQILTCVKFSVHYHTHVAAVVKFSGSYVQGAAKLRHTEEGATSVGAAKM